jgi:hypothetical protein
MPTIINLKIHAATPIPARDIAAFIGALDEAYSSLRMFEIVAQDLEDYPERAHIYPFFPYRYNSPMEWFDPDYILAPSDRLVLSGARFSSAGFWEVIGSLNPLEQIRKFLNDRHERKKDTDYRSDLEKRRLGLENEKLATEVLEKQIDVLVKAGLPKTEIRRILGEHYHKPLTQLGDAAERAAITTVEKDPSRKSHEEKA